MQDASGTAEALSASNAAEDADASEEEQPSSEPEAAPEADEEAHSEPKPVESPAPGVQVIPGFVQKNISSTLQGFAITGHRVQLCFGCHLHCPFPAWSCLLHSYQGLDD